MTDERLGDSLWDALERLPRGAGVVFRHYRTDRRGRRALFARIVRIARRRRLVLVRAGDDRLGRDEGGTHGTSHRPPHGLLTWPVHDRAQALAARRAGADALFVSPIYATRSHPRGCPIGAARGARIGRGLGIKLIALGGVTPARGRALRRLGYWGWAAIDAWADRPRDQKRNAVPT